MPKIFAFLENSIILQSFNHSLGDYGFLRDTFELWNLKNFFLKIFLIAGLTISSVVIIIFFFGTCYCTYIGSSLPVF